MNDPLRHGVIGCGRVFERLHLPVIEKVDGIELTAICDTDLDHPLAAERELFVTSNPDRFFAEGDLDSVSVCTPNDAHDAGMLTAIDWNVPVLCEKPLAARIEQARLLSDRARSGPLCAVNLPYRFHESVPMLRAELAGREVEIDMSFTTPGQRLWRPRTRWYGVPERAGGGALLDLGVHALDVLIALFGPPNVRSCTVDDPALEERAVLELEFPTGPARVSIDRASRSLGMELSIRVSGRRSPVVLDIRRGTLKLSDDSIVQVPPDDTRAVSGFFEALSGTDPDHVVSPEEALSIQEVVHFAYQIATTELPTIGSTR